ncbi:MAG TPA: hypothetical protein VK563_05300 [Puia sp.]|nr:hypothetical protein [Puia sp.]
MIAFILCLALCGPGLPHHPPNVMHADQSNLAETVKQQAEVMGQAFMKGDYKTFAHYTYPQIIRMMGGEKVLTTQLVKITNNMKEQGMTFSSIGFGDVSKIEKKNGQLQCTIPQHTTIKVPTGRAVSTSTLIAISTDAGKSWTFVDTSNKDIATIRKLLPDLSPAIVIPPQQPPVRYND